MDSDEFRKQVQREYDRQQLEAKRAARSLCSHMLCHKWRMGPQGARSPVCTADRPRIFSRCLLPMMASTLRRVVSRLAFWARVWGGRQGKEQHRHT